MYKFKIRNKTAIYLDHRELINNMYNKNIAEAEKICELQKELFHFHERGKDIDGHSVTQKPKTEAKNVQQANDQTNARKRKSKNIKAITELTHFQAVTEDILQHLRQYKQFQLIEKHTDNSFPRYWEEITAEDFPIFNGANNTTAFQDCKFGALSYIIPPQCKFFNCQVEELTKLLPQLTANSGGYDLIVLDPPWRNKYIRRLKRARQELAYKMLNTEQLSQMPMQHLVHKLSIVAIWCTNSSELQRAIVEELLPKWNLRLLQKLYWLKINTNGKLIGPIDTSGMKKQPFEMLYIACHLESEPDFGAVLQNVTTILSVPSIVHSHKPPLLPWLKEVLPENPNCLEIFARYLQPQFTSIGLEVLKLMDERLYTKCSKSVV
ncbi:N(6)-adenine-specific methyltransferase METTL4 [Zeugodacus cucurbitae]|uniref:Methyltransferase-like protein 4 n=1 Tax=Zeugodacus cucurbitae TaxID=28588 RepID=A0A0A1XDG8_ZEUCU|nr:N(6)-adenine-specific methyltransferase METTL4 [Zeugodacus cucurbitae]